MKHGVAGLGGARLNVGGNELPQLFARAAEIRQSLVGAPGR